MHDDRNNTNNPSQGMPPDCQAAGSCAQRATLKAILRMDASLEAIRDRIDEAYNNICMDLPDINMEIFRTFQQASDTLGTLVSGGPSGTIANVVEGLETSLQNVMLRIKQLRNQDARFLEIMKLTGGPVNRNRLIGEKDAQSDVALRFLVVRAELMDLLLQILDGEDDLIRETSSRIETDVRSLEFTLSSAVEILKDLISRSNTVKEPILKIMAGLQTHDIVNQDITTISLSLRKMHELQGASGQDAGQPATLLFQKKASRLSSALITQLIHVVLHHGRDLENEISHIENLIFHVKEDKDAISEFLLMSLDEISTFDIVTSELRQMFTVISEKLGQLGSAKEKASSLKLELAELIDRLAPDSPEDASRSPQAVVQSPVYRMAATLKPHATALRHAQGLQELRENSSSIHKDADHIRQKLEEIKHMLIGSIRGIDIYSGRCLNAIMKFKKDIQELMKTLEGSGSLLEGLESMACSLEDTPDGQCEGNGTNLPPDLDEILYRLENPHSSSLVRKEIADMDEGLTFF